MKKHILTAVKRTITGNRVSTIRKTGFIPATLYGKGMPNSILQVNQDEFLRVFKETGEAGLIHLSFEEKEHPVLIANAQLDPIGGNVIHIEFHEVNLREKIKANVPVVCLGEAVAVKENLGTLLQIISEVEVEALPTDLPEKIEIDVSRLALVNDSIFVKDIPAVPNVAITTDPEQIVVKIGQLLAPEPEPVVEAPVEGVEGAVGAEGETPKTEGEAGEAPKPEASKEEAPKEKRKE